MKPINIFILLVFILLSGSAKSQTTGYFIWNIGYTNLNGNYLELGTDYYLVTQKDHIIDFGATANLAYFDSEFVIIPEGSIGYHFNFSKNSRLNPHSEEFNGAFYLIRVSGSPYHITPEIGVSLLSLFEINAGWGFEFNNHNNAYFDGLKLGVNFKIPFGLIQ